MNILFFDVLSIAGVDVTIELAGTINIRMAQGEQFLQSITLEGSIEVQLCFIFCIGAGVSIEFSVPFPEFKKRNIFEYVLCIVCFVWRIALQKALHIQ